MTDKVFGFLKGERLVLKLPRERMELFLAAGEGEALTMGGRTMREWIVLDPRSRTLWPELVRDSAAFVRVTKRR